MKIIAWHSSPNVFDGFDLNKIVDTNDSELFGIYFQYHEASKDVPMDTFLCLLRNSARFGLNKSENNTAYMYLCGIGINDKRVIDVNSKIDYKEFSDLCELFSVPEEELMELYQNAKDNHVLFNTIIKSLRLNNYSNDMIAEYFINSGYDAFINGNKEFGTIVLFNTNQARIVNRIEYNKPTDFCVENLGNLKHNELV